MNVDSLSYPAAIFTLALGREVLIGIEDIYEYIGEAACWAITFYLMVLKLRKIHVKDLYKTYSFLFWIQYIDE